MRYSTIVISILAIIAGLLVWFGKSHGVDNLSVVLALGGAIACVGFGGSRQSEGVCFGSLVVCIVGILLALCGAGFLAAGALFIAAVLTGIAAGIFISECW